MNKMTSMQVLIISILVSAMVLGGWYTVRYNQQQEQLTKVKEEISVAETVVAEYRDAQRQLPALREEIANLQDEKEKFIAALPKTSQITQIMRDIRSNAETSGVAIKKVSVATGEMTEDAVGIYPIKITMNMDGNYQSSFRALRASETGNRFSLIDGIQLTRGEAVSFDPMLNTTVEMVVYTFNPDLVSSEQTAEGGSAPVAPEAPVAPAAEGGS